jgi:hypothetical protein
MVRKRESKPASLLENIMKECLGIIGIKDISDDKVKLLLRLYTSGIAYKFFLEPDNIIDVGFLRFEKSPTKEELFKVTLNKSSEAGVVNAKTLWRYYKGELYQEKQFKELVEEFLTELIQYSEEQEISITQLTNDLQNQKRRN